MGNRGFYKIFKIFLVPVLNPFLLGSGSVSFLPGSGSVSKFGLDPDKKLYGSATLPVTTDERLH